MELTLDFQDKVPIYLQIVEQVQGHVAAGRLKAGDQLPTVREVAADLRVNFNTVARAYRLLHEAGVISTQQGRGTYVLGQAQAPPAGQDRQARLQELITGWLAEAARLGYAPDEIEAAWRTRYAPS
jgi:GntR family transcriptional regulator